MKKRTILAFLFIVCAVANLNAYEVASMKNPNLTYNDIVWNFYSICSGYETDVFHHVKYDWKIMTDEKKQNYYWTIYEEDIKDSLHKKTVTLWIDNGYIRLTFYDKVTKFPEGFKTWNLMNFTDYFDFHNTMAKTLTEFFSRSELEKKKHGQYYTQEEKEQFTYLMNLFARV